MKGGRVSSLAGWLFADLLLVMVLVVLGGQVISPDHAEPGEDGATSTASPTGTPSPSGPGSRHTGMRPGTVLLKDLGDPGAAAALTGGGDAEAARERILERLRAKLRKVPERVAMVVVWGSYGGCATCAATTGASSAYAHAVENAVREAGLPRMPTQKDFYRSYHDLSGGPGGLRLEIFVYYPD